MSKTKSITNEEAIAIFSERCDDLRDYAEIDTEQIKDYDLRQKARFRQKLYELNKKNLEVALGREGLH